jgi:type IV pilus assembly protein PilB
MAPFQDEIQNKRLDEIRRKEEEERVKQNASSSGIPYVDLSGVGVSTDALRALTETEAREHGVAAFKIVGKTLHVATKNPNDPKTQEMKAVLEKKEYRPIFYLVSERSLEKAWDRYNDVSKAELSRGSFLDISDEALQALTAEIKTNDDIRTRFLKIVNDKNAKRTSQLMELIFGSGIATKSSDVHIEPQEEDIRLRFRQDGVLQDIVTFDPIIYRGINSRIKLLSGMKLTETEDAQDGRFTISFKGQEIEIRTSVIPSAYGEAIVMRILNPDGISVGFEQLGFEEELLKVLEKEIAKPNGLILTTGPTGSGKTTTLYSFLKKVYNPEIKILTIEDPIEYHLPGISQTQVNHEKGYDFLSGLRAALRQDPDIIMVGEIRDKETATIAVNASLTGHLVLSTLHTNNAAGAIPRLIDLGIKPGILASALTVAMAQRLVRKLCVHCKASKQPTEEERALLEGVLQAAHHRGKDIERFGIHIGDSFEIMQPTGCEQCNFTGYKGRVGLYEAILTDEHIEHLLVHGNPTEREVFLESQKQGIFTMQEDSVIKVVQGITSLEEVQGVVDLTHGLLTEEERATGPREKKIIPQALPEKKPDPAIIQESELESKPVTLPEIIPMVEPISTEVSQREIPQLSPLFTILAPLDEEKEEVVEVTQNEIPETPEDFDSNLIEQVNGASQALSHHNARPTPVSVAMTEDESIPSRAEAYSIGETQREFLKHHMDARLNPRETTTLPQEYAGLPFLVDFLKRLEDEQRRTPSLGAAQKIALLQEMILDTVTHSVPEHHTEERDVFHDIINSLETLRRAQHNTPSEPVHHELEKIRQTIQKYIKQE